jgi:hypothetical protein
MTFDEILEQAIEMLRRRGRVSYGALKRQFALDDEYLADLIAACKCLRPIAKYPYGTISDRVTRTCSGGSRRRRVIDSRSRSDFSGRPDVH